MACEIARIENDLVSATVYGLMRMSDLKALQNATRQVIAKGCTVRLLSLLEGFQGWEKGLTGAA